LDFIHTSIALSNHLLILEVSSDNTFLLAVVVIPGDHNAFLYLSTSASVRTHTSQNTHLASHGTA